MFTFGPGLHYLAHHPVPVLVDADHLELVAGPGAQIVNLDFSCIRRIYRELDPVRHPRVFFSVPADRSRVQSFQNIILLDFPQIEILQSTTLIVFASLKIARFSHFSLFHGIILRKLYPCWHQPA